MSHATNRRIRRAAAKADGKPMKGLSKVTPPLHDNRKAKRKAQRKARHATRRAA